MKVRALHVMRTYGASGGEQQLAQFFSSTSLQGIREVFVFVYRDTVCEDLYEKIAPRLAQRTLSDCPVKIGTAWIEFFRLVLRLPILQWRFWKLLKSEKMDICFVHGFQAALVAWPTAIFCQKHQPDFQLFFDFFTRHLIKLLAILNLSPTHFPHMYRKEN